MSKSSGFFDVGDTPAGTEPDTRPEQQSGSSSPGWTDALEALLAVSKGTLRRDLPGAAPGVFDTVRRDAQAYALAQAQARRGDRTGAAAALKSAAADFAGMVPAEDERRTG